MLEKSLSLSSTAFIHRFKLINLFHFGSRMSPLINIPQVDPTNSLQSSSVSEDWLGIVVAALSILGSIFNIVVTFYVGKYRFTIGKMIILLAIFGILTHVPSLVNSFRATNTQYSCEVINSWVSYFGYTSSLFFTTCFAHSLFHVLIVGSIDGLEKYYKKYIALSVISGFLVGSLSVLLKLKEYYTDADGSTQCRIRPVSGFSWASLLIVIIPGVVNIIGCTVYYIKIIKILRSRDEKLHLGLLVYPLILIICITPAISRRVHLLFGVDLTQNKIFQDVSRGLFGSQGFFNSLAYGLSREIYRALKECCSPSRRESNASLLKSECSSIDDTSPETQLTGEVKRSYSYM